MHRNIFLLLITFSLTSSAVAQEHTLELTLEETIEQARQQSGIGVNYQRSESKGVCPHRRMAAKTAVR